MFNNFVGSCSDIEARVRRLVATGFHRPKHEFEVPPGRVDQLASALRSRHSTARAREALVILGAMRPARSTSELDFNRALALYYSRVGIVTRIALMPWVVCSSQTDAEEEVR